MTHFLLKDPPEEGLLGEIVLVRSHNNDLLPALVMQAWSDTVLDLLVFDGHDGGRMFNMHKVPKDIGLEQVPFYEWTWMFRKEKQEALGEYP